MANESAVSPATRVVVDDPLQFQTAVTATVKNRNKTFVLFTAGLGDDGQPWCPDARAAEPKVWAALDAAGGNAAVVRLRLSLDRNPIQTLNITL